MEDTTGSLRLLTDPTAEPQPTVLRCASWSRVQGLDPVGTAGSYRGYLLVDLPLPWPADVADSDELGPTAARLGGAGIRIQAVVPTEERRATLYLSDGDQPAAPGASALMRRRSLPLADGPGALSDTVDRLLDSAGWAQSGSPFSTDGVRDPAPLIGQEAKEVLLCTYGRRDLCCGSRGAALHAQLADVGHGGPGGLLPPTGPLGAGVALRRTSHTGGHRFAPTAIVLPEATAWAYLDVDVLAAIISRRGDFGDVAAHYRGWAGLASPRLQALERAVLMEAGWGLLDRPRWAVQLGSGESGPSACLTVAEPDGALVTWRATVEERRRLARPECGQPPGRSGKVDVELAVGPLERIDG